MKQTLIFFLIVLLSSCGNFRRYATIKYVKVQDHDLVLLEKEDAQSNNLENQQAIIATSDWGVTLENEVPEIIQSNSSKDVNENLNRFSRGLSLKNLVKQAIEIEDDTIIKKAKTAERKANKAKVNAGVALISVLFPLIGFGFFIAALNNYTKAKNSRYITLEGEANLKIAATLIWVDAAMLFIRLVLLVGLILLILL